ncbi:MAG: MBL fold metallo-hydrolase [Firmicutes bacterium]|nr:MBL fold metallo-hydrolase [Bacillota bacterium]
MKAFQKIRLSQTNCYLLKANMGCLLIDCGSVGDERELLSELGRMGLSLSSIRYLLLTHHHSDHCGLLHFLLSANPGMNVIMSERCAGYLETGRHFSPPSERYADKAVGFAMGLLRLTGGLPADTFPPYVRRTGDIVLKQEEMLPDFVGIRGKLLYTPGHTEDSISLVVGEDAFVGDAARNILNIPGSAYEPILYCDRVACFDSWEKLITVGTKTIHPSHGRSFSAARLKRNI